MSILATVVGVITAVGKALAVVGFAMEGIKAVTGLFMNIAKALGLIKPEVDEKDLGDKALQAEEAGIRPEKYKTYAEYHEAVENFKVDPEKSKKYTEKQKLVKAAELSAGLAAEKLEKLPVQDVINLGRDFKDIFSNAARSEQFSNLFAKNPTTVTDVYKYLKGMEKNEDKAMATFNTLVDVEKASFPGISDAEAKSRVRDYM